MLKYLCEAEEEVIKIQTVYIDVYFMINFTVNGISLYFAAIFSKIPTKAWRILACAMFGAMIAVILLLMFEGAVLYVAFFSLIFFVIVGVICPIGVGMARRVKLVFLLLLFEVIVGGLAHFIYSVLDKTVGDIVKSSITEPENRRLLLISLIILLSVGVFKALISFFSNRAGTFSVDIKIYLNGECIETQAFVDTGNLAKDPMDGAPVLLVKATALKELIPDIKHLVQKPYDCDKRLKNKIRIIPISRSDGNCLLVGIKADKVCVRVSQRYENLNLTVAIDKEGGTYDGCYALMPSVALDNVF